MVHALEKHLNWSSENPRISLLRPLKWMKLADHEDLAEALAFYDIRYLPCDTLEDLGNARLSVGNHESYNAVAENEPEESCMG